MTKKTRILLVDDDPAFHAFLVGLLQDPRIELVWADNGTEALKRIRTTPFDLHIVDYQLPDMLGTEILKKIQDDVTPTVMFTGYGSIDLAVDAMKKGAVDFFTKPLTEPAAFVRFLNRTLSIQPPLPLPATGGTPPAQATHDAPPHDPDALLAICARLDPPAELSRREAEILAALLEGKSNKEIASRLFISEQTVKNHLSSIYRKCRVEGRGQLFHHIMRAQLSS